MKPKLCFILPVLLISIVLAAVVGSAADLNPPLNSDSLLLKDGDILTPNQTMSAEAAGQDIRLLEYALKNAYVGSRYGNSKIVAEVISDLDGLARNIGSRYSSEQFCNDIAPLLYKIPDGHMNDSMPKQFCGTPKLLYKDEQHFLHDGAVGHVGANLARQKDKPWELNWVQAGKIQVPVVSVTSFPDSETPGWSGFLETIQKLKDTAPAIIFDMRGNSGGDSRKGERAAAILYGQETPSPVKRVITLQTPAAVVSYDINTVKFGKTLQYQTHGNSMPAEAVQDMNNRMKGRFEWYAKVKTGEIPPYRVENLSQNPLDTQKVYNHPIYILIDKMCVSSCEAFVEYFEAHPYARTVGENTGGLVHFGNHGLILLPNSNVTVRLPVLFKEFRDNRFVERTGYAPAIKSNGDALEQALRSLAETLKLE
ncbi:MAG: S41 family peptidase [Elusimicrobiales bacterium]|nr:S41 family peptidase [Elusimicrobiales bacterium]